MKRLRIYSVPYLGWMILFILIPSLLLIMLAFSNLNLYNVSVFDLTLAHFQIFAQDQVLNALWNSLKFSILTTLICFAIGYPVAFYLSRLSEKKRKILMALMIVPLWSNMLLRIIAWEKIFTPESIISDVFGISFNLLGSELGVLIGLVAMYLPFMIFPIFSVLEKLDSKLIEAASDLGASRVQTFFRVIFPLSSGGVVSGVIMTMLPAMTSFVLPARIGLGNINLIGNIIESKFIKEGLGSSGQSINDGSIISLLLMVFSVLSFVAITRVDKEGETLI